MLFFYIDSFNSLETVIADEKANGDYRLIFNTGKDAGQTVFHAHAHVLTGTQLPE